MVKCSICIFYLILFSCFYKMLQSFFSIKKVNKHWTQTSINQIPYACYLWRNYCFPLWYWSPYEPNEFLRILQDWAQVSPLLCPFSHPESRVEHFASTLQLPLWIHSSHSIFLFASVSTHSLPGSLEQWKHFFSYFCAQYLVFIANL